MTGRSAPRSRRPRVAKKALIAAGATVAAAALGVVGERYLVRQARSRPDPERDEPLEERPGDRRRLLARGPGQGSEGGPGRAGPAGAGSAHGTQHGWDGRDVLR